MFKVKYFLIALSVIAIPDITLSQGCMDGGASEGVSVKGFIQPQYNYNFYGKDNDGNDISENSFVFNRARVGFIGSIPYDVSYYFFIETSAFKTQQATPHLLDAFVTYSRLSPWAKFSIGQFKSPFSLEQNTSCSGLHTINRSFVVTQLASPQRDLGLMISGGTDTSIINYSVAIMNGYGMGIADENRGKDIIGRVISMPLFNIVKIGGSFRSGTRPSTSPDSAENNTLRYGGEIEIKYNNFLLQGEYIAGSDELLSTSKVPIYGGCGGIIGYNTKTPGIYHKNGYFVHAMYMTKWNIQPVIKYESYEPDTDTDGDIQNIITFGLNYFLNDWSRIQINYLYCTEETADAEYDNDQFMIQIQVKF